MLFSKFHKWGKQGTRIKEATRTGYRGTPFILELVYSLFADRCVHCHEKRFIGGKSCVTSYLLLCPAHRALSMQRFYINSLSGPGKLSSVYSTVFSFLSTAWKSPKCVLQSILILIFMPPFDLSFASVCSERNLFVRMPDSKISGRSTCSTRTEYGRCKRTIRWVSCSSLLHSSSLQSFGGRLTNAQIPPFQFHQHKSTQSSLS